MSNHTIDCEECGEDTRGLSGGHAAGCSRGVKPRSVTEGKKCPYCSEIITNDLCGCDRDD
jgi:hypothetical protein